MADVRDEQGNLINLTDEHGNPVQLTDEHGNPMHLQGVATVSPTVPPTSTGELIYDKTGVDAATVQISGITVVDVIAMREAEQASQRRQRGDGQAYQHGKTAEQHETEQERGGQGVAGLAAAEKAKEQGEQVEAVKESQLLEEEKGGELGRSSSSSSSSSEGNGQGGERRRKKKGLKEIIKEKLKGGKQRDEHSQSQGHAATTAEGAGRQHQLEHGKGEEHEKKGVMEKIKDILPGHHNHNHQAQR